MISLSLLTQDEKIEIKKWPQYQSEFLELDYAVRDGGWLDTIEGADFLSIKAEDKLIGFIGLYGIKESQGEILIAMHPDYTGKGYGKCALKMAIEHFFTKYSLLKITLCVRKTNKVAKHVYEKLGFVDCGESSRTIQGKSIDFWDMYIDNSVIY
jgi:diamine N-acetyltransferase